MRIVEKKWNSTAEPWSSFQFSVYATHDTFRCKFFIRNFSWNWIEESEENRMSKEWPRTKQKEMPGNKSNKTQHKIHATRKWPDDLRRRETKQKRIKFEKKARHACISNTLMDCITHTNVHEHASFRVKNNYCWMRQVSFWWWLPFMSVIIVLMIVNKFYFDINSL